MTEISVATKPVVNIGIMIPNTSLAGQCPTADDLLPTHNFCNINEFNKLSAAQQACLTTILCGTPAPATIQANGAYSGDAASGGTYNMNIHSSDGDDVGSVSGDTVTVADSTVNFNSTLFDTVDSEDTINVPIEYVNGTPVGSLVAGVVQIPNPVVCASVSVAITDSTPDVGQLVTITATPSNFTPTTYVFLLPQGGGNYVHVSQASNTYEWYVSAEGSWDVCVLATDTTDYVYGTVAGTSNATLFAGLDTTPHYAFSVTECLSADAAQATKFITIRRDSDNATSDFTWGEFIGGDAETWVGANDGFITWLFDHSGNGRPYSTNSSGVQPKIIDTGVLITDGSGNVVIESAAGQALYTYTDGTQGQLTSGANTGLTGSSGALFTAIESTDTNYTTHGESGYENGCAKVISGSATAPEQFLGTPTYKVDGVTASPVTAGQLYTMMNGSMSVLSITVAAWSTNAVWNNYNRPHMSTNFGSGFVGTVGCQIVFNDTPTASDITEIETHLMATY